MHLLRSIFFFLSLFGCWLMQALAADLSTVEQKASACFGCHGGKGKSHSPAHPSLAGQQSVYLVNQLNAYKTGTRKHPNMQAQAGGMTAEDINNYGAYFTVQEAAKAGGDAELALQGKDKAAMCLGCHGAAGEGKGEFPRLAGQHPDYLAGQLANFKNGSRQNATMQGIAAGLSEADMKALAAYFGSL